MATVIEHMYQCSSLFPLRGLHRQGIAWERLRRATGHSALLKVSYLNRWHQNHHFAIVIAIVDSFFLIMTGSACVHSNKSRTLPWLSNSVLPSTTLQPTIDNQTRTRLSSPRFLIIIKSVNPLHQPSRHSKKENSMSLPISNVDAYSNSWPSALRCDQPATAGTHVFTNAMRVLQLSLLSFIVLRSTARHGSTAALIGLSLIIGGFLHDIGLGLGLPGIVNAATTATTTTLPTTTVYSPITPPTNTCLLESAGECASSVNARSTLCLLSLAFTVILLALITSHLHRSIPAPSKSTSHRLLAGRFPASGSASKPPTSMESIPDAADRRTNYATSRNKTRPIRIILAGTLAISFLFAMLLPVVLADPGREVTERSAQDGISPIWITCYSTTTTWLPVVTITAPPVLRSGSVCTEADPAVCPVVGGRKTGIPARVVSAA